MSSSAVSLSWTETSVHTIHSDHFLDALLEGVKSGSIDYEKAVGKLWECFNIDAFASFDQQARSIAQLSEKASLLRSEAENSPGQIQHIEEELSALQLSLHVSMEKNATLERSLREQPEKNVGHALTEVRAAILDMQRKKIRLEKDSERRRALMREYNYLRDEAERVLDHLLQSKKSPLPKETVRSLINLLWK